MGLFTLLPYQILGARCLKTIMNMALTAVPTNPVFLLFLKSHCINDAVLYLKSVNAFMDSPSYVSTPGGLSLPRKA